MDTKPYFDYEFALVQYRGHWYRTLDDLRLDDEVVRYFDCVIVFQTAEDYLVIKNRYDGNIGKGQLTDLLKMKLFATGKTFDDLPRYDRVKSYQPGVPITLGYRDNGDLYEYHHQPGIR